MKLFFTIVLMNLMILNLYAYVTVNGIYYNLDSSTKTAEVTYGETEYKDTIIIPDAITYNNVKYVVNKIGEEAFYGSYIWSLTIPNSVTSIGSDAFGCCSNLYRISLPNSIKSIGDFAFAQCTHLKRVYCYANSVPETGSNAFQEAGIKSSTLYVPTASIDKYKDQGPWCDFGQIKSITEEKCATPTISYNKGKITVSTKTEGAEIYSEVLVADAKKYYDKTFDLSVTYEIKAYAAKTDYDNSDTSTAILCWIDADPSQSGTTDAVKNIVANPVLIKTSKNTIFVEGATSDYVEFYSIKGNYLGSEPVHDGAASFETEETFVLVKIGDKTIKTKK